MNTQFINFTKLNNKTTPISMVRNLIGVCILGLIFQVQAQESLVPVSIAKVISTEIYDEVPLSGSVTPMRSVRLSPLVDGSVVGLSIAEGETVDSGQTILTLDPTMAKIEVDRVRAQLQEIKVQHRESIRQRDELVGLRDTNAVADTAIAKAESDVLLNAARLQRITAELKRAEELLNRHEVKVPFSGVIAKKWVELGSWVDTNSELVELVETTSLKVEVAVPQQFFSQVGIGTPVSIAFDSLPDATLDAMVTTRIPVAGEAARTFPVHIEIQNHDQVIAPGMSARVTLQINHSDTALVVPSDAIIREANGEQSIWRVKISDGISSAENIPIQTGRNLGGWVEVIGILEPGDSVVVHGNESLTPDKKLVVTEEILPAT